MSKGESGAEGDDVRHGQSDTRMIDEHLRSRIFLQDSTFDANGRMWVIL